MTAARPPAEPIFRDTLAAGDPAAIRALVADTGFFRPDEVEVAVEVVEEAMAKGQAASGYFFLMADDADGLAGYANWGPIPCSRYGQCLYWLAVAPGRQRRGLGRRLLAEAERRAAAAGGRTLYLDTSGMARYAPTRAFYERCGYGEVARIKDFYIPGDDKVTYAKPLVPAADLDNA